MQSKPERKPDITPKEMLEISARLSKQMDDELSLFSIDYDTKDRILKSLVCTNASSCYQEITF